jgi:hypothetical protein
MPNAAPNDFRKTHDWADLPGSAESRARDMKSEDHIRILILETAVPDTLRHPGEVVRWPKDKKIPKWARALDADETADQLAIESTEANDDSDTIEEGSPEHMTKLARQGMLQGVVDTLNEQDDSHWTASGQPAIVVINHVLHERRVEEMTTRAELRSLGVVRVRELASIQQTEKDEADTNDLFDNED